MLTTLLMSWLVVSSPKIEIPQLTPWPSDLPPPLLVPGGVVISDERAAAQALRNRECVALPKTFALLLADYDKAWAAEVYHARMLGRIEGSMQQELPWVWLAGAGVAGAVLGAAVAIVGARVVE